MTSYYSECGVLMYRDSTTDIEDVKKVLDAKKLCVAILDNGNKQPICVKRGTYKETFLLYNGHAYMV